MSIPNALRLLCLACLGGLSGCLGYSNAYGCRKVGVWPVFKYEGSGCYGGRNFKVPNIL